MKKIHWNLDCTKAYSCRQQNNTISTFSFVLTYQDKKNQYLVTAYTQQSEVYMYIVVLKTVYHFQSLYTYVQQHSATLYNMKLVAMAMVLI